MRRLALAVVLAACNGSSGAPTIDHVTPSTGPIFGGTRVVIEGNGFVDRDGGNRVLIGGREAPLVVVKSDTMLDVVIPPAAQPGDVDVFVFNDRGNGAADGAFRYSTTPVITGVAPADVVFSSGATITVTGVGFLDEGAGAPTVLVDGTPATDVHVVDDTTLTFTAVAGRALSRPDLDVTNARGTASRQNAFRFTPGSRGGLLLFSQSSSVFATFFDPRDNSSVIIPRVGPSIFFTTVYVDARGEYWAVERNGRFGLVDLSRQDLVDSSQVPVRIPAMARIGEETFAIDRSFLNFGRFDPPDAFTQIGNASIPCCGSYGMAYDGSQLYFTSRNGTPTINTIDQVTGILGTPVALAGVAGLHVEEMRFFEGTLYATNRDGTLVTIDPTTGATAVRASPGRANAMEVFE